MIELMDGAYSKAGSMIDPLRIIAAYRAKGKGGHAADGKHKVVIFAKFGKRIEKITLSFNNPSEATAQLCQIKSAIFPKQKTE